MIKDSQEIFDTIVDSLKDYTIETEEDFHDYLYEVVKGMIDVYNVDLLESVNHLWQNDYLEEVHGDLIKAIQLAQYQYYRDIADSYIPQLFDFFIYNYEAPNTKEEE